MHYTLHYFVIFLSINTMYCQTLVVIYASFTRPGQSLRI